MEFSFSTYDVKKFIESLDGRASEIDKRIKAIEAAADSFNVQVSSSCDRVQRIISEEQRKLHVIYKEV